MSKWQRISSFIWGIGTILLAVVMFKFPAQGINAITAILGTAMTLYGLRSLIYYLTMARHMVSGLTELFRAIIALDAGIILGSTTTYTTAISAIYLLVFYMFNGVVDIMRARESKNSGATRWKLKMSVGVVEMVTPFVAIIAGLVTGSSVLIVYLYGAGLVYSGLVHVIQSFRRSAIVYIQ